MDVSLMTKAPRGRPFNNRGGEAALTEAIRRAGGIRALARALGNISPQSVSTWGVTPAVRVLEVERVTGVSRYKLRPDVFGPEPRPPTIREG
jgi:DNA-binding transcriptional regulator YdaS (Cro superfamily)